MKRKGEIMTNLTTQQYTGYTSQNVQASVNLNTKQHSIEAEKAAPETLKTPNNTISNPASETNQLSQQEVASIFFNRQATQLTKDLINIYAEVESSQEEVTPKDINEFHRKSNRNEFVQNYDKQNTDNSQLLEIVNSQKQITNQESAAVYLKHQENELTEKKIEIYIECYFCNSNVSGCPH